MIINLLNLLNEDYELTIAYINHQYANYPTKLIDIPLSDEEWAELNHFAAMAQRIATEGDDIPDGGPLPAQRLSRVKGVKYDRRLRMRIK